MVNVYYEENKNLVILAFCGEMGMTEIEKLRHTFNHNLTTITKATMIGYHAPNTYIIDKNWQSEIGKFMNSQSHKFEELYVVGLEGVQKLIFRLFTKILTQPIKCHVVHQREVESKFSIQLVRPFEMFTQIA